MTYYALVRVRAEKDGRLVPLQYTVGDQASFDQATVVDGEYTIALCTLLGKSHEEAREHLKKELSWFAPLLKCAEPDAWFASEDQDPGLELPPGQHCDDYIHDFTAPHCLRFFLLVNRMPAVDAMLCHAAGVAPKLFATHKGARVRIVMASRMGDVGITRRLDAEDGYEKRVMISALTDFGDAP